MTKRATSKNLFGERIRQQRPRYEAALKRTDKAALPFRAARIRWISERIPKNAGLAMPIETFYVFEEAKSSFIYGNFVAAVVLAAAFVEHWFSSNLAARGYEKEASQGLAALIKIARAKNLVNSILLDKVDHLRAIRNPFVHLQLRGHQHTIGERSWRQKVLPESLLEADAKDALIAMYGVARHAFRGA